MAIDTAPTGSGTRSAHPLDALGAAEIETAADVLRADGRLTDAALFAYFGLDEPSKQVVVGFTAGDPVERRVRVVIVPGPAADVVEAVVDVGRRALVSWRDVPGVRPGLLYGESFNAIVALHEHPEWQAALARRGITDLTRVQIDPWPAGQLRPRRTRKGGASARCISYYRETDADNGYARPIEGAHRLRRPGRGEVLEVVDDGVVPLPPERGSYLPRRRRPDARRPAATRDHPARGAELHRRGQPRALAALVVAGVAATPAKDSSCTTVGYERRAAASGRSCTGRRSARWSCPTATRDRCTAGRTPSTPASGASAAWRTRSRSAATASARSTTSTPCSPTSRASRRRSRTRSACTRRTTGSSGSTSTSTAARPRSVARVASWSSARSPPSATTSTASTGTSTSTAAIQLEVKLTGIISTAWRSPADDGPSPYAPLIAPGLAAPHHQHLFSVRLDFDVDGTANSVYEVDAVAAPPGPDNPWRNAFQPEATLLATEHAGPARSSTRPAAGTGRS